MTGNASPGQGAAPLPPRGLRIGVNLVLLVPSPIATWYFFAQPMRATISHGP